MPRKETLQALTKAFIGLAWEDGTVTQAEMNLLKDVTFQMPEMTAEDWGGLALYWLAPINADGLKILFDELRDALQSEEAKAYAFRLFSDMVELDGEVTAEEVKALAEAKAALDTLDDSLQASMGQLLESVLGERTGNFTHLTGSEHKIYDTMQQHFSGSMKSTLGLDDYELEKLALAGALMAQVAYVDQEVNDAELRVMDSVLQREWSLQADHATMMIDCVVDAVDQKLNQPRLFREFYEITLPQERVDFVGVLYRIADAHEGISDEEETEIQRIGQVLKIEQEEMKQLALQLVS